MKTLREYIHEAEEKHVAIGHFNISNLEGFHAVVNAAKRLGVPAIIGFSEGEQKFFGKNEAVALVTELKEKENLPIFLNADHHYSFESVKEAIDAGFDSVVFDGAKLNFEENILETKKCVAHARSLNSETLVEGELGYIGAGSNIKETIPEGAGVKTRPEDAQKFAQQTGIDLLAPSVGSIHGLIKSGKPHIDGELVSQIRKSAGVPLVLHGGSGLRDEDFRNAIKSGISIIHISTEIRLTYDEALKKSLADNPSETTPYKILEPAVEAIEEIVEARLKLFNNIK